MMFLQYAILGVRAPVLPSYLKADPSAGGLGFNDYQVGWILAVAPAIGSMSAPFIAGQLADRYFASERYLAVALLVSGAVQWLLAWQDTFSAWAALSVAFAIGFYPTIGLTNALAMAHLPDARSQFAQVRLWGTIGWIAVAWTFPALILRESFQLQFLPPFLAGEDRSDATARIAMALQVSALLSFAYAMFCLLLPHTPPHRSAPDRLAFVSAFRLIRRPSFFVLIVVSLFLSAVDRMYFLQTAPYLQSIGVRTSDLMPAMAIAQVAEVPMLAVLGMLLSRLGFRCVLSLGAFCYCLRFSVFATPQLPIEVIVSSQLLHGVCFSCGFTAAAIYVDRLAPADARHSAQTGFGLCVMAPGAILGGLLNGVLSDWFATGGALDYRSFWLSCAGIGLVATLGLIFFFRDESHPEIR